MMGRQPLTKVEIDIDYCTRTFGIAPCTATLTGQTVRKCYNTWNTCRLTSAYNKGVLTYTFVDPSSSYPKGETYFPCLIGADGRSGTVNIAGSDDSMYPLGKRSSVSVKMVDFPYNDRFSDKYQAERVSGVAQTDEPGYDPFDRMSFWTKFKARNPNYAGRPLRIIDGYVDGGVFTATRTRHYVMTEIKGPDDSGNVTIEANDVLKLADNDRAVAPAASRGYLSADIDASTTSITLLPAGVGAEYDTSGWAVIGSEIVSFTRTGDNMTISRGTRGTNASTHSVNDTVQQTYSVRRARVDTVVRALLRDYAGIDTAYIPFSEWQAEVDRWAPNLELTADICKPEGVAKLIGELMVLGVSIWWDDVAQQIKLRVNHPEDASNVVDISDRNNIVSIKQEDKNDSRLTRVSFWTVQIDPTKALNKDNFLRQRLLVDVNAENQFSYGDVRIEEIYCRWLNQGADNMVRVLSRRLLNRFNRQPVQYTIEMDQKDDIDLVDVIRLSSRVAADEAGKPAQQLMQVIKREDVRFGHRIRVVAQKFQFDGRYAYFTEDTRPDYDASSQAQRDRGAYFSDGPSGLFSDGTGPYVFA